MMSKMLDDTVSPRLKIAIPPRRVTANSLVGFFRELNFNHIRLSGSPRYIAPIKALANMPDSKTANSG